MRNSLRDGWSRRLALWTAVGVLLSIVPVAGGVAAAASAEMGAASRTDLPHTKDHVLVKLAPEAPVVGVLGKGAEPVMGRWHAHPVPPGQSPIDTVKALLTQPGVETAELDYQIQVEPVGNQESMAQAQAAAVNDPYYSYQWHLPAVQTDQAWSTSTGKGVVVAVVDSGVSKGGFDLDCHTFVAPYNAITQTAGAAAASDDNGHGTHVAGTVAQCTNNGVGVAGVAFDARLMPVKVLNEDGSGAFSWIARGIDWARANGADIINLSLGCDGCSSSMVDEAIEAARAQGIVIVAASGNSNKTSVGYPASHPDVIAVGATDFNNVRAPYSNRGSALDLVAPGGDTSKDANGDRYGDGVLQETFGWAGWGYYFFQGTSMATAHVSGAAALLLAEHPGIDPETVSRALAATALDLGASGFDTSYGRGLIQLHDVLGFDVEKPVWPPDSGLRVDRYGERSLTLSWSAATDNVGLAGYSLALSGSAGLDITGTKATVESLQPGTPYVFEVLARDEEGNWSEPLEAVISTARRFGDTSGHTFYGDILWMSGSGVTRGCNPPVNDLFCPDDPVTRGQMAAFLARALGLTANTHPGFDDVPSGSTFAGDIGKLATAGVTRGCNPPVNDLFCPDDPVTRGQMAAFLVRALDLTANTHPGFDDVPSGSTFAGDIGRLATAGVTRGCNPPVNDLFCPEDPVTRGQLAAFLRRALG
jgi:serine protease